MERLSVSQANDDDEEFPGLVAKMARRVQGMRQRLGKDVNNGTNEAESKWAELCLLGATCQECTRQRFLESFSSWFNKLLPVLKQQKDPVYVRSAALASLTDLIVRLGGLEVANVRRDGAFLISKIIQPLLHCIGDKESHVLVNEATDLLIAILKYFPNCLRQQSVNVEVSLVARLVDVNCHSSVREKCAKALAFLPRANGDAASWSSLIRRVLIAVNEDLDFALRGMEDASVAESAIRALLPVGQDPPRPLGGQPNPAITGIQPGKNLWQQFFPRIFSLLQCCKYLLTSPYPTPVPAPVGPLLTLIMRILRVDGSRSSSRGSSLLSSQQVSLRAELPALHLSALELLGATLRGVRGQLLPRGAALAHLLTEHFRHTGGRYPSIRIKLYAISRDLFIAMGAGMASALAPAVVGSAFSDLKGSSSGEHLSANAVKASQGINPRKRKEAGGGHATNGLADGASTESGERRAPLAVQVAALQALEALLNTGGALLPERWRGEVDTVLAGVAIRVAADTTSFNLSCDEESSNSRSYSASSISVDVQVAAYQALLASLLAPCGHRPPYLAQGLALFRNGRKEAGSEVATVCARALTALEPLIHPRCLPYVYSHTETASDRTLNAPNGMKKSAFGGSSTKTGHLAVDPWAVLDTWLGYDDETSPPAAAAGAAADDNGTTPHNSLLNGGVKNALTERVTSANVSMLGALVPDRDSPANSDEVRVTAPFESSRSGFVETDPMETETQIAAPSNITPVVRDSTAPELIVTASPSEKGQGQDASATRIVEPQELQDSQPGFTVRVDSTVASAEVTAALGQAGTSQGNQESSLQSESVQVTTTTVSSAELVVLEAGSESDSDGPLPDIVDGDPDTESD